MTIRTTMLNDRQTPRSIAYDLTSQMDGTTQTFTLPITVPLYCDHHLVWNGQVYHNDTTHSYYALNAARTGITTNFDKAPKAGTTRSLQFVCDDIKNITN